LTKQAERWTIYLRVGQMLKISAALESPGTTTAPALILHRDLGYTLGAF
jgi:hypothetical protein